MKIEYITNTNYIVYIKKENLKFDVNLKNLTEKIFNKLNKLYKIDNTGYYSIDLYKDDTYGMILEVLNIDPELFSYKLNVDLNVIDTNFFIALDDICEDCYIYKNKFYKKIKTIKDYDDGILEFRNTNLFRKLNLNRC